MAIKKSIEYTPSNIKQTTASSSISERIDKIFNSGTVSTTSTSYGNVGTQVENYDVTANTLEDYYKNESVSGNVNNITTLSPIFTTNTTQQTTFTGMDPVNIPQTLAEFRQAKGNTQATALKPIVDISAIEKAKKRGQTRTFQFGNNTTTQTISTITTPVPDSGMYPATLEEYNKLKGYTTNINGNGMSYYVDFGNETISQIYDFLRKKGMDDVHIAAILGNIQQESGSRFDYTANYERIGDSSNFYCDQLGNVVYTAQDLEGLTREQKIEKIKGLVPRYGGIGLIQWTGGHYDNEIRTWVADKNADRKSKFINWCNLNNRNWTDLDAQLEFFYSEYDAWHAKDEFEATSDLANATNIFCGKFEYPEAGSENTRINYAINLYNTIQTKGVQQLNTTSQRANQNSSINTNLTGVPQNGSNNKVPYFSQDGNSWSSVPFGDGTIATSGCSITSFAMVASYLKGGNDVSARITPDQVQQKIIDTTGSYRTYHVSGTGASWDLFPALGDMYGLKCETISSSSIIQSLKDGKPVIMSCHSGDFTSRGHFIVLTGIDESGNIYVNDPNGKHEGYSYQTWSLDRILSNAEGGYWAYST